MINKQLSKKLISHWKGKWNDNYTVSGIIKPYAKSYDILSYCKILESELNSSDRVILSIGTNDTNPFEVCKELCLALSKLKTPKVLIIPIYNNNKVNTDLLNNYISSIVKLHNNCIFINRSCTDFNFNYLTSITNLLIHEISKIDYNDKYIVDPKNFTNHRVIQNDAPPTIIPRKGTIPYYFKSKALNTTLNSNKWQAKTSSKTMYTIEKKGTIPFYFKKAPITTDKFFRE